MTKLAPYLKAITAALVAGLGVLALALEDGNVSAGEWVNITIAFLTALGAVWAVPNKDPLAAHQDESVQPPDDYEPRHRGEDGAVNDVALLLLAVIAVLVVLIAFGVLG